MRIAQLREYDTANGEGIRVTIFISGCNIKCKGCFNKEYQSFEYGNILNDEMINKIIDLVNKPEISGLSILGGEPLDQNPVELGDFLREIKYNTNKSIWMWTGHNFETLDKYMSGIVHKYIDILIDGKFNIDERDLKLRFKGSKNQRIIDIQGTIKNNKIVILEGDN